MNAFLVVAILGVSASGPLVAGTVAPALAIAFWRNAAASILIAPLAAANSRAELQAQDGRGWIATFFAGAMLAAHFATRVSALKLTAVAAATALVTRQLVWVVLIDRVRRPTSRTPPGWPNSVRTAWSAGRSCRPNGSSDCAT